MRLDRLRLMVAGSIAPECEPKLARYAHKVVREVVAQLAPLGVRFEAILGKAPPRGKHGLPVAFDWIVTQSLEQQVVGGVPAQSEIGPLLSASMAQKHLSAIPANCQAAWEGLINANAVELRFIEPGWTSGAVRRARAAEHAHALLAIGGGEGVEHLAQEFLRQGKAVIPLDLAAGNSSGDGTGGAPKLFGTFLAAPSPPYRMQVGTSFTTLLGALATKGGSVPAEELINRLRALLEALASPQVFYVRLLALDHPDYSVVEAYFRKVIDPVVQQLGFESVEMGCFPATEPWINSQIFRSLHNCELAVVDLTGLRPNCLIELGYALGRNRPTVVTAREGTKLPFDITQYSAHFWHDPHQLEIEKNALLSHWIQVRGRPPLVST